MLNIYWIYPSLHRHYNHYQYRTRAPALNNRSVGQLAEDCTRFPHLPSFFPPRTSLSKLYSSILKPRKSTFPRINLVLSKIGLLYIPNLWRHLPNLLLSQRLRNKLSHSGQLQRRTRFGLQDPGKIFKTLIISTVDIIVIKDAFDTHTDPVFSNSLIIHEEKTKEIHN